MLTTVLVVVGLLVALIVGYGVLAGIILGARRRRAIADTTTPCPHEC